MPRSANSFRIAVLKIVHWPVFDSFPDISNLRCSFARSSLFTCLNCSCSSLLKERRCLMKLKTSSFVICFKSVISIFLLISRVKVLSLFGNKSDLVIFLLFIFRLITLKESEFMDLFRVITLKTFRK